MSLSILRQNKASVGSLAELKIVPIELFTQPVELNFHKTVVTAAIDESVFHTIYFTEDKGGLKINHTFSEPSRYSVLADFFVPVVDAESLYKLRMLMHSRLIALITDTNRNRWLVGNVYEYARMNAPLDIPVDVQGVSGYQISLSGSFSDVIPLYLPD
jgi:hypothetical protein